MNDHTLQWGFCWKATIEHSFHQPTSSVLLFPDIVITNDSGRLNLNLWLNIKSGRGSREEISITKLVLTNHFISEGRADGKVEFWPSLLVFARWYFGHSAEQSSSAWATTTQRTLLLPTWLMTGDLSWPLPWPKLSADCSSSHYRCPGDTWIPWIPTQLM